MCWSPLISASMTTAAAADGASQRVRVGALVSLEVLEREHIARVVSQSPSLEVRREDA